MNKFYLDDFNISKIAACVFVKAGMGQLIHKNRQFHGLVIEFDGSRKYVFDTGVELITNAGDVFYLPKFSNYEVFRLEEGDCLAINFDLYDEKLTYEPFVQKAPYKLQEYFEDILTVWELKKTGYKNACMANLYSIIYDLQKNAVSLYTPSHARKLVNDAVEYIHENLSDYTLSVNEISGCMNISSEYLRRLFQNTYKISPKQYIIDARMKKAKELLLTNELMISQVARLCGYDNESYFSCEFKRINGLSPSEYKK